MLHTFIQAWSNIFHDNLPKRKLHFLSCPKQSEDWSLDIYKIFLPITPEQKTPPSAWGPTFWYILMSRLQLYTNIPSWDRLSMFIPKTKLSVFGSRNDLQIILKPLSITSFSGVDFLSPDARGYWILWSGRPQTRGWVSGNTSGYKGQASMFSTVE